MTYQWNVMPLYSQTEADMRIGAASYLRFFQDVSAKHLLSVGKGNDTIPVDYGICWIVSKYRLQILERAGIENDLIVETWIEPEKSKVRLHPNVRISDSTGSVLARGQMELCLTHIAEQLIALLPEIEFPFDLCADPGIEHPKVRKLRLHEDALEPAYSRVVRYSDLDNNHHMNNLRYVNVAFDAFTSDFHRQHPVSEVEVEYLGQCHEGDTVNVFRAIEDDHADVLARNGAGETVLKAVLSF